MQTIVYQCDTAMPAQKLPNCCNKIMSHINLILVALFVFKVSLFV